MYIRTIKVEGAMTIDTSAEQIREEVSKYIGVDKEFIQLITINHRTFNRCTNEFCNVADFEVEFRIGDTV